MAGKSLAEKDTTRQNAGQNGQALSVDLIVTNRCFGSALAVALDVFGTANVLSQALAQSTKRFECSVRSLDGLPVVSSVGKTIPVDGIVQDTPADMILVFGPGMADVQQVLIDMEQPETQKLTNYLANAAQRSLMLGANCSSTFLLAEAGVLDGQRATTSWWLAPTFRMRYRDVQLVEDELLVAGDKVVTAGAALAQIDLSLHLVRQFAHPEIAHAVARYLIVDDARRAQGPFMVVSHMGRNDRIVTKAEAILRADLARDVDVEALARDVGVTSRTLTRHFVTATGMPPASFWRRLRLEVAAGLLRSTNDSIAMIAERVGYEDERAFRRAFLKSMQESPSKYRRTSMS